MNYTFSNLLGASYRGGNLLIKDNVLLSPIGNRIGQVDLVQSISGALPFENLKQIRTTAVSPDGTLLLSIDVDGRALIINRKRSVLLQHFSFKESVTCAQFSPDGRHVAVGVGRLVQVWVTPSLEKQFSPMQLHRTYGQCHSDITDVSWSPCGRFIAASSKDITIRVFSLDPIPNYDPPTLAGHKDAIIGTFFSSPELIRQCKATQRDPPVMFSLSADGALHCWGYVEAEEGLFNLDNLSAQSRKKRQFDVKKQEREEEVGEEERRQESKRANKKAKLEGKEEEEEGGGNEEEGKEEEANNVKTNEGDTVSEPSPSPASSELSFPYLAGGKWFLVAKYYLNARGGAQVSCYDFHPTSGLLVIGLTHGIFDLYQLPEFQNLHTLNISRERISSVAFNQTGDWIAVGCAKLGQLLVWDWRAEGYVAKQQGHSLDITTCAFSGDGALIATGAEDHKVKIFQQATGFCFVTFKEHKAPVTAVQFVPSGHAVVSASLDGTVRAFDLVRYRNFRTLTSPSTAVQFVSLSVDPSGEIVCAGTQDTFQIFVWSLKTGRLLDILAGHEGPVGGLAFCPAAAGVPLLASCSWDKTVRTWEVFGGEALAGGGLADVMRHSHDVLAVAYRPDGKQIASATLGGQIYFWDPREAVLESTIDGKRDIRGGRLTSDRRSATKLNGGAGCCFTSLAYSADGSFLVAGGSSKFVCVYDVQDKVMLRRFQVSANRSLDGVLDVLNSKHVTDAGPLQLIDHDENDGDAAAADLVAGLKDKSTAANLPGSGGGAAGKKMPVLKTRSVALCPTGKAWAAATTEGLVLFTDDVAAAFDPTDLAEDLTPIACHAALVAGAFQRALLIALRLNDATLIQRCIFAPPPKQLMALAAGLPLVHIPVMLKHLAMQLPQSPHLEFLLRWVKAICVSHGDVLRGGGGKGRGGGGGGLLFGGGGKSNIAPALRMLQKEAAAMHRAVGGVCESALYSLKFLEAAAAAGDRRRLQEAEEEEEVGGGKVNGLVG